MRCVLVGLIALSLAGPVEVDAQIASRAGPVKSAGVPAQGLASRRWTLGHFGADGLHKCRAFHKVREHAAELQRAEGGRLTRRDRKNLEAELRRAKSMPPAYATPVRCGVPL